MNKENKETMETVEVKEGFFTKMKNSKAVKVISYVVTFVGGVATGWLIGSRDSDDDAEVQAEELIEE